MAERSWNPIRRADGTTRTDYDALLEGFPPSLRGSVRDWIADLFLIPGPYGGSISVPMLRRVERALKLDMRWYGERHDQTLSALTEMAFDDPDLGLDLLQFLLSQLSLAGGSSGDTLRIVTLLELLDEGASAWRVVLRGDRAELERRVDETTAEMVSAAMADSSRPSDFLRMAWREAWSPKPNASDSYHNSVRAVEAAICPLVLPANAKATLGLVITALRDKPSKFTVRLHPNNERGVLAFAEELDVLWKGQEDRHGNGDVTSPLTVSVPEAQDAVVLAAKVVHWLKSGAFSIA